MTNKAILLLVMLSVAFAKHTCAFEDHQKGESKTRNLRVVGRKLDHDGNSVPRQNIRVALIAAENSETDEECMDIARDVLVWWSASLKVTPLERLITDRTTCSDWVIPENLRTEGIEADVAIIFGTENLHNSAAAWATQCEEEAGEGHGRTILGAVGINLAYMMDASYE